MHIENAIKTGNKSRGLLISLLMLATGDMALANGQTVLASRYPELQQLLLAHDVVQARAYEE
ncbi:MAG: hypothetical protein MRY76_01005, partial [Pseudomonadales bacterium]|nr:hypothetical protein [Pseudomonadales bacterium]